MQRHDRAIGVAVPDVRGAAVVAEGAERENSGGPPTRDAKLVAAPSVSPLFVSLRQQLVIVSPNGGTRSTE